MGLTTQIVINLLIILVVVTGLALVCHFGARKHLAMATSEGGLWPRAFIWFGGLTVIFLLLALAAMQIFESDNLLYVSFAGYQALFWPIYTAVAERRLTIRHHAEALRKTKRAKPQGYEEKDAKD
ncbi:MAG: hypothetical protein RLY93_01965 [Sumerlaeia bacterium]